MSIRMRDALLAAGAAILLAGCAPLTVTQGGAWQLVASQPLGLSTEWVFGLADDRVLALGTHGVAFYDPAANTWRPGASVPVGFVPSIADALADGRLFVTLQPSSGPPDAGRAMLYDPNHDRWVDVPPMGVQRVNESLTALRDGSLLVAGGYGPAGPLNPVGNAERFDPARGLWSLAGTLNDPRSGQVATLLADGRAFILGGTDANQNFGQLPEIYDPSRNTWTAGGRLLVPSQAPQVIALRDGRVLEVAGFDFIGSPIPVSELYDPRSQSWKIGPPMPSPGGGRLAMMSDGRVLLLKASLSPTNPVFRAEIFDPKKMLWTASTIVEGEPGAAATLRDGRVITIGPTASWIYDPSAAPPAPGESGLGSPQTTLLLGAIAAILLLLVLIQYVYARAAERRRIKLA